MSFDLMYPRRHHFSTRQTTVLAAIALIGAGMSGCASVQSGLGFADRTMDVRSPVATEAEQLAHTDRPMPKFTDIPPLPTDVRPAPQYGMAAARVEAARAELEQQTAPESWSLTASEDFASQARRQTPETAPASPADTEAFAAAARKRATPPPPVKR
ncbi:hypothetical protein [Phenylobacterium immobile]|uniref:hypothetical protein n=1 Tax=Phenylobacterium immobile TaxID=21 RepID=UPI000A62D7CD|nr:hypothetical protein [Phenylobacterium immobile]